MVTRDIPSGSVRGTYNLYAEAIDDNEGKSISSTSTIYVQSIQDCYYVESEAIQGSFSQGYRVGFETVGKNVTVTFEILDNDREKFDFITLAHVIEHVHDPYKTIKTCFELLNRKGKIWIDTPNIESLGLQIYGRSWLGLDCPRHLVMFSNNSLYLLLKKAGFKNIKNQPYRPVCENTFRQSSAISDSIDPFSNEIKKYNIKNKVKNAERTAFNNIQKREFITLTAERC